MSQTPVGTTIRAIDEQTSIIAVQGSVTSASEAVLMDAYVAAVGGRTRNIVLDFRELEYLNSSGIGLIVTLLVRANRQGQRLSAYGLTEHYRHIFELTRLNDAIAIHDAEDAALMAASR
jgi:anti-sigma B factor antagonist